MALTAGHDVFAGLHEDGINKFIHNVYLCRPYYFHYATPLLGGGTPGIGILSPLQVPGAGFGLEYSVEISQPVIDFFPQDASLPLPGGLTLGPDQFSLTVEVRVCVACGLRQTKGDNPNIQGGRGSLARGKGDRGWKPELVCATLRIWAVGHPTVEVIGPVDRRIGLMIDEIIVKEVCDLEKLVECIATEMVNALLEKVKYTVSKMVLGAFGLVLAAGPNIRDDQLKVWGDIV